MIDNIEKIMDENHIGEQNKTLLADLNDFLDGKLNNTSCSNAEENAKTSEGTTEKRHYLERVKNYLRGCTDPNNARLYGTFQERAALNISQFPKIQGSLLIRMGLVYPLVSYLVEKAGIPKDAHSDLLFGAAINYHTWIAGYLAYLVEIQGGFSKHPMELVSKGIGKIRNYVSGKKEK